MGQIVRDLVSDSFGDANYARAAETLGALRQGLADLDEPAVYNDLVRDLKRRMLSGELGGDRREMWWRVRTLRLGLVDQTASDMSLVTPDEAAEVRRSPFFFWWIVTGLGRVANEDDSFSGRYDVLRAGVDITITSLADFNIIATGEIPYSMLLRCGCFVVVTSSRA